MVLAHTVDAWTAQADRTRPVFYWTTFAGGLAAPAFLFLAGLGTALSGASQRRRGVPPSTVGRALVRRGLIVFALAFAFRLQAFTLGLGQPVDLLKVDVLNVMGLALVLVAVVWWLVADDRFRVAVALSLTTLIAFAAPLVRTAPEVDLLPLPVQWYLRPTPGRNNFTLLPWMGFVTAGFAIGVAGLRHAARERRHLLQLTVLAVVLVAAGYWASWQPSIYAAGRSTFWGASPTFFAIRLGLVVLLLPLARAVGPWLPRPLTASLATLGAASLFVYWVHVELVYGGPGLLLRRRLPLEVVVVATVVGLWALARLVPWARGWVVGRGRAAPLRQLVAKLL